MQLFDALINALGLALAMSSEISALILGPALSATVQAVVSKREMIRLLPDDSPRSLAIAACGLGAASRPARTPRSRWLARSSAGVQPHRRDGHLARLAIHAGRVCLAWRR
jgi:hypothetical protein